MHWKSKPQNDRSLRDGLKRSLRESEAFVVPMLSDMSSKLTHISRTNCSLQLSSH